MANNIHIFDIDGVLADSWQAVSKTIENELGLVFTYEQLDKFLWSYDLVKAATGDEQSALWADNLWFEDEVLTQAPIASGVEIALQRLFEAGDVCCACTSRPARNRTSTLEWFETTLPFFPRENVFIRTEEEENNISGDAFKKIKAIQVAATHQYDDALAPLKLTRLSNPAIRSFLVNRPWNEHESLDQLIRRIDSIIALID